MIVDRYHIPQVSTGDILRAAVKEGTDLGKQAKAFMAKGELVPDEVVIGIIDQRLRGPDCKTGFILDGFPRTTPQAEALQAILTKIGKSIDHVVNIEVDSEELVRRLTGRRTCKNCGGMFHILFHPPAKEGVCDRCGGTLYQREDDLEEAIRTRLKEYQKQTAPLIRYYQDKRVLRSIQGVGGQNQIFEQVIRVLNAKPV
jgi:adenylate kinase